MFSFSYCVVCVVLYVLFVFTSGEFRFERMCCVGGWSVKVV